MTAVIKKLASGEALDAAYRDHPLGGNYVRRRECHITPDWQLIYEISECELILFLTRTGTHNDLSADGRQTHDAFQIHIRA